MSTNVPAINWDNATGLTLPEDADILLGRQLDFNAAFGVTLNHSLETPQGQLCSSEAAIISDANAQWAYLVAGIDPNTSSGVMQDGILALYRLERLPALPTSVDCVCTGLVGTVIAAGSRVIDTAGNIYASEIDTTIPASGSVTINFVGVKLGAIPCPAGTVNKMFVAIQGWDTVINPSEGVIGRDVESRGEAESRRKLSVAINAKNSIAAIRGAVLQLPGVIDAYATENVEDYEVSRGATGYVLKPHSIYVCVSGGDQQQIADTIFAKKGATGANMNGDYLIWVYDTDGYTPPYPRYDVIFHRPRPIQVFFNVSVTNSSLIVSNYQQLIAAAVISAFAGNDGGERARIGSKIYASRFMRAILAVDPNINVIGIKVGFSAGGAISDTITIGIDQIPTISADSIGVQLL